MTITIENLVNTARLFASLDGENPEYDRALVELVCSVAGESELLSDDREEAEKLVLGRTTDKDRTLESAPTPAQIVAARSYVNACENVGLNPDPVQAAIAKLDTDFGATPGETDVIESTIEPEQEDSDGDVTPVTAWMVLNDQFSVCLTRVTGGEDAGAILVSLETLTEESQRVIVERINGTGELFNGEI